jgi:outer membrane protein TolC
VRKILVLILLFFVCFLDFSIVYSLEKEKKDILSIDQCIKMGLDNNHDLLAEKAIYASKFKTLDQAKSTYYPQLDLNVGYLGNNTISKSSSDPFFKIGSYNYYTGGLALSQNIYDFGRREDNVKIQEINLNIEKNKVDDQIKKVVNNVKNAFYNVLKNQRLLNQNKIMITKYTEHLTQTKFLYDAGKKPKYDVTKALVDLSNSQLNLLTTQKNLNTAWANLNYVLGVEIDTKTELLDDFAILSQKDALNQYINFAYNNRSDYLVELNKAEQAKTTVFFAEKDYYPKLTGSLGYNFAGTRFPVDQGWNVGAALSWNLFNGFNTQSKIDENKRLLDASLQNIQTLKLKIALEIKTNYYSLIEAEERIKTSQIQITYSTEMLSLSELRYVSGVGTALEITDATTDFNSANVTYINALYDYKISLANLEKAMGK